MGKEGSEAIIQLVEKDMKIARDSIKAIPTRKIKEIEYYLILLDWLFLVLSSPPPLQQVVKLWNMAEGPLGGI